MPADEDGFVHVDAHCKVTGARHVWAAGDGIAFPVKFGGLAAEQADAAAEAIAQLAGADVVPRPFKPVLRGRLLTGHGERYMHHVAGGGGGDGEVADHTLWWPPSKVAGRRLAPYLAARDEASTARSRAGARRASRSRPTSRESSRPLRPEHQPERRNPMLKTIVVGVDGREGGRDALALAGRLALLAGGELVAVRAAALRRLRGHAGAARTYNSLADAEAQRQVEQDLAEAGLTARTRLVADASPARALHRMAEALDADVIVVGSTRRGAVGRRLRRR